MSIFHLASYREVIQQKLKENSSNKRYKALLSDRMGIQTSHFSQVLTGKIDLNADQGSKLCDEWKFNEEESEYFINLISLERATTTSLKAKIRKRLSILRLHRNQSENVDVLTEVTQEIDFLPFYSDWIFPAICGALKFKAIRTESDIAQRLEVQVSTVSAACVLLEKMKLIELQDGNWTLTKRGVLNNTRYGQAHAQAALRNKGHQLYIDGDTEIVRFSSMAVLSEEKYFEYRSIVQKFFTDYHAETLPELPNQEELVVLNLDFFRIGRSHPPPV